MQRVLEPAGPGREGLLLADEPLQASPGRPMELVVGDGIPGHVAVVSTLGPAGTSSELAARALGRGDERSSVRLRDSYEDAYADLIDGSATHFLVANAYHGANVFYMDLRTRLERAFVFDTPLYGLATRRGPVPLVSRVSTHPAPEPLIRQLAPAGYRIGEVRYALSTSAAAAESATGEVDLALTTVPAAEIYDLQFISALRTIRMLWSVFVRQPDIILKD